MATSRFVEHYSQRLNFLVRGIEHPPLQGVGRTRAQQIEAGLYVTVLMEGSLRICCGDCISTPRRHGMQVLALRERMPWSAQGQPVAVCAVGVSMLQADLQARGMQAWFEQIFAPHEKHRQVQVAADPRSMALVKEVLDSDPGQPLSLLRLEAAAQAILVCGISALEQARPCTRRERLRHLAQALDAAPGQDWTLAKMADMAGMSARAFSDAFRQEFGDTPFGWLRQRRLLRGRQMVLDEGVSVSAAALSLGFCSAAHFSHAFRQHFGQTPSQMRRACEAMRIENASK